MAEDNKGSGLFWLALLLFGGCSAWAINKFIVPGKVSTIVPSNNSNTTNNINVVHNPLPTKNTTTIVKSNAATKAGYPYSITPHNITIIDSNIYSTAFKGYWYNPSCSYADEKGNTYNVIIDSFDDVYLQKQIDIGKFYYIYNRKTGTYSKSTSTHAFQTFLNGALNGANSGACFIAGTLITVPKGVKEIQDLKVNDIVVGRNSLNKVIKIDVITVKEPIFGINDIEPFVTGEHPFLTKDGWKSISANTKHSDIEVGKLEKSDEILRVDGSYLKLSSITDKYSGNVVVYNITLNGNNTYFANGLCVHNKLIKLALPTNHGSMGGTTGH